MKWLWSRMQRVLLLLCLILGMSFCTKDHGEEEVVIPDIPEQQAEYYVRYRAYTTTYVFINGVTVTTPKGTESFKGRMSGFDQTFGPVPKGFKCSISADAKKVEIYVCRGAEPFSLKATGTTSASYVIDF